MKKYLIALAVVASPWSHAENQTLESTVDENWYQVEVLIFKNKDTSDYLVDLPAAGEPKTTYQKFYSLVQGTALSPLQIPLIDAKRLSIQPSVKSLTSSRKYAPIFLAGWKMYLPGEQEEIPVKVEGGEIFDGRHELEGFVTIKRNRYLHIEADLAFITYQVAEKIDETNIMDSIMNASSPINTLFQNKPRASYTTSQPMPVAKNTMDTNQTTNQDALTTDFDFSEPKRSQYIAKDYQRLKEARRLRSGELHYLDHPSFGVLVRINGTSAPIKEAPHVIPVAIPSESTVTEIETAPPIPASD